ncbi:hypothetical protein BpHYR1_037486 [Brachionus plicatilis]|uniref:Uncharacterized protein n=1 Tax=Brachionus plicatilis TaxID=10195 RepID=A0A3M7Q6J9_BRAPC|nr:hypothetical protein BpHYR1_037486 [Brachionus plicatilis]
MTKINSSKEEALRIRVYAFFNENRSLGKIFTVRHFIAEKNPRNTVYRILKRSEYLKGSKDLVKHHNISQRQAAKKFDISQQMKEASNNT